MKIEDLEKIKLENKSYFESKKIILERKISKLEEEKQRIETWENRFEYLSTYLNANDIYIACAYLISKVEKTEYINIRLVSNDDIFNYIINASSLERVNPELYDLYMKGEPNGINTFKDDDRLGNPYDKDFCVFSIEGTDPQGNFYKKVNINERYSYEPLASHEVKFMLKNPQFSYVWEYIYDVISYQIDKNDYANLREMMNIVDVFVVNKFGKTRLR